MKAPSTIPPTILCAAFAAALALVPTAPARQAGGTPPPRQPPPEEDYDWRESWPGRSRSEKERESMVQAMQGMWRLVTLDVPGRSAPERAEVGYLLVSGRHLSMEIHGSWFSDRVRDPRSADNLPRQMVAGLTQTGIHRFELDEWSRMTTRSVIGTKSTIDGAFEFEPPGTARRYELQLAGESLQLHGDDGRTLVFERENEQRGRRDFFGRPVQETDEAAPPREPLKRDIYGRPIREPAPEKPPEAPPEEAPPRERP
jgi:hypothetical protein